MYGIVCLVFLVLFVAVNVAVHDEGAGSAGGAGEGEEGATAGLDVAPLGPHGVPGSHAMPRALSSSKLEEDGAEAELVDHAGEANLAVAGNGDD